MFTYLRSASVVVVKFEGLISVRVLPAGSLKVIVALANSPEYIAPSPNLKVTCLKIFPGARPETVKLVEYAVVFVKLLREEFVKICADAFCKQTQTNNKEANEREIEFIGFLFATKIINLLFKTIIH